MAGSPRIDLVLARQLVTVASVRRLSFVAAKTVPTPKPFPVAEIAGAAQAGDATAMNQLASRYSPSCFS